MWLPGSEEGRNHCPGCDSSELHGPIGNTPGSTMWSSAGTPPMSCPPPWRRQSPEPGDDRCCWEGSCGSCSCIPYSRAKRGGTDHTGTGGALHFRARGGYLFDGRTGPHTGKISINTTRTYLLAGKSNPCRFGKGYNPGGMTGSLLSRIIASDHILLPGSQRGMVWVPIPGSNPGVTATAPVQTLRTIWLPSKDPRTLNEHDALPATHKWPHCLLNSLIPESDQKYIVSSFMSVNDADKLQASLIIEWIDVTQHQDHPILSTPLHFFWVNQTPPLYDNQCMVLFPDWASTCPLEWNRTSNQETL